MSEDLMYGVLTGKFPKEFTDDGILISNKYIKYIYDDDDSCVYEILKEFWIGKQHYP